MTPAQTQKYFREWGAVRAACLARGWAVPDRHELHRRALGRDKSSKAFTNAEFDKVLQVFWSFSKPDSLNAGLRQERQPRTRLEHKIKFEQMKLLAVVESETLKQEYVEFYAEHPEFAGAKHFEPDFEAAYAYVQTLLRERFGINDLSELALVSDVVRPRFYTSGPRKDEPTGEEKSDLECLRDTLDARINARRNARGGGERGWSIHDLKTAAGVECFCATHCRKKKATEAQSRREAVGV
jgi:hypothetical protein